MNLQASIPNFPDVTSWVAETAIRSGVAGLAALVALGWLAVRALRETRAVGDRDSRAAVVALVASLTGLLAVTLITSYQFFFWALLAYVAGARHSAGRRQTFSKTDAAVS